MVGLYSSTNSKPIVIGGILTIALADALSDSIGMHTAVESQNRHTKKEIWEATYATFVCKFIFSSFFIIPALLFSLEKAVIISIIISIYFIFANSLFLARKQKISPVKVIIEHISLTLLVIVASYLIGTWISITFN